jgi:hypothetical protein
MIRVRRQPTIFPLPNDRIAGQQAEAGDGNWLTALARDLARWLLDYRVRFTDTQLPQDHFQGAETRE